MNRILWGVKKVAPAIVVCTAIAVVAFALDNRRASKVDGPTLKEMLGLYWGGGLAAGILLGILKPLWQRPLGRLFAAAIAALPVSFTVVLMSVDWRVRELSVVDIGIALALAAVFGPFAAEYARLRFGSASRDA